MQVERAIAEAQSAVDIDPIAANARQNRVFLFYLEGRYAEALAQAIEALAIDANLPNLHYLQGLSYRETAAVLDEPTGTVKWRTREALNRLRAMLCDEVPDHAPRTTSEPGPVA